MTLTLCINPDQGAIRQKRQVFILSKKIEPEILDCQNRERCSRVLNPQEVSDLQLATRSSDAIAFEELNDEGSDTTVFRAWNTVTTCLHDQTTYRQ